MNRLIASAVGLIVLTGVALGAEVKSGLQVGDSAGVFHIKDVTGPNKGKSHCYR